MLRNLQESVFKMRFPTVSFNMMASNVYTVLVMLPFSQFLMLGMRGLSSLSGRFGPVCSLFHFMTCEHHFPPLQPQFIHQTAFLSRRFPLTDISQGQRSPLHVAVQKVSSEVI